MFTLQNFTCLHFSTLHVYTAVHYMFTLQYITCLHCSTLHVNTAVYYMFTLQYSGINKTAVHYMFTLQYITKTKDKTKFPQFYLFLMFHEANISLELENQLIKKIKFIIAVFLVHGNK